MVHTNYGGPESSMLHTKFLEIGPPVPEKKFFLRFLTIYGHGGHLGHVTWTIYINFSSPFLMLHMKFCIDWTRGFRGEDL